MTSSRPRSVLDVSHLPTVTFGHRNISWWGTLGFMAVEATTLAACVASYLYLRKNFQSWPPLTTPNPDLLVPTINMLLLLVVIAPMAWVDRAAKRLDLRRVRIGLLVAAILSAATVVLRVWEFGALNTHWDMNAYGSAAWVTLGFHTTLLLIHFVETMVIAVLMFVGPIEKKHFSDVSDAALYQYFLSLVYVPLYLVLFLSPRWM